MIKIDEFLFGISSLKLIANENLARIVNNDYFLPKIDNFF
jgi:hypothetical protein